MADEKRTLLKIVSNDTVETTELTFHTESAKDIVEVAIALVKVFQECPSIFAMTLMHSEELLEEKIKSHFENKSENKDDKISDIDFNKLFFNKDNED